MKSIMGNGKGKNKSEGRRILGGWENKIYLTYLLSYIVIGIFPLVLSLSGYKICENIITDEIKASQDNILVQIQGTFERYMENAVKSGQLLSGNDRLHELAEIGKHKPQERIELKKLRDDLALQKENVELCSQIMIFFYKSGTLLTSEKVYQEKLTELYFTKGDIDEKSWKRAMEVEGLRGYIIGKDIWGNQCLLFVENVYNYNYKEKLAVIITAVPWKNIQEMTVPIRGGKIYWLNRQSEILTASGMESENFPVPYEAFKEEGNLVYTGKGKDKEISSFLGSRYYDWKYCITMSEKYFFQELNSLKIVIVAQMIILIFAALIMALYYAHQNYKPIERIITVVRKNQRTGGENIAFSDVENYLEKLYVENQKMGRSWKQVQDIMAGQVVSGYLKGWNTDAAMVDETLKVRAGINLQDPYVVFLITLQDISQCKLFTEESDLGDEETRQLLQFIFSNIFNEIVLSHHRGVLFNMDSVYVCIIQQEGEDKTEDIICDMKECSMIYQKHLNLSVFIGASKAHIGINELQRAYNEVVQVLSYQTFWGNETETLVVYESAYDSRSMFGEEDFLVESQNRLYNLMLSKEYANAADLLEEMMDRMFIHDVGYTEVNQCRMFGLVNTVCMYLADIIGRYDEGFLYQLHPMERFLKVKSVEGAKKTMRELFDEIVYHLQECLEDEKPAWIQGIIQEVESDYRNVNLNVSMLAEKRNMNLAYIGRTFKLYMGYSLPDYIHMLRIRECKKLLMNGMSVKDAAEAVGYIDSKSLIRVFKKQEGITPGHFKDGYGDEL